MIEKKSGFDGGLRHYHRAANSNDKNWNAWVDGVGGEKFKSRNLLKILIITSAILALVAVVLGLIVELR